MGDFIPTALQLKNPSADCLTLLADMDEVDKIEYPAEQVDEMKRMLDTLSSVFSLLTGIALALAFVVCYNMGLMNFVERTRDAQGSGLSSKGDSKADSPRKQHHHPHRCADGHPARHHAD